MNTYAQGDAVNAVIGNESWARLQSKPLSPNTDEEERISTHLRYVISLLKNAEVEGEHIAKREQGIALLEEYVKKGAFPNHHRNFEERRPCFIDSTGNICAVGYLVEQTAGRAEAERINDLYQYAFLHEMKDDALLPWQKTSGFSLVELAIIQPAYGFKLRKYGNYYDPQEQLYGIVNNYTQQKITPPIFTSVQPVADYDLFLTQIGERYGITNAEGKEVVKHVHDEIQPRSFGDDLLFIAKTGVTLSVFDVRSNLLATVKNGRPVQFNHSFIVIEANGRQGALGLNGDWVIPISNYKVNIETLVYHTVNDSSEKTLPNRSLFVVQNENKKYGVFNSRGKQIIPFEYSALKRKEFVWIAEKDGKKSLLLLEGSHTRISNFTDVKGISVYSGANELLVYEGEKCGLINREGKWKIPQKYKFITKQLEFYHAYNDSGFACYDQAFHEFISPYKKVMGRYRDVYYYYGKGIGAVKKIDGSFLIAPTKDSVAFVGFTPTNEAVFARRKENYWELINDMGTKYMLPKINSFKSFSREHITLTYAGKTFVATLYKDSILIARNLPITDIRLMHQGIYAIKQNGKYGTVQLHHGYDKGYRRYYSSTLDTIYLIKFQYNNLYMAAEDGKIGMLDLFGKVALPFEYDDFREEYLNAPFKRGVYLKKGSVWYYFSKENYAVAQVSNDIQLLLETSKPHHEVDSHQQKLRTMVK
tara:strand:- start:977 stop:3085 length:2109 start_codon:yes stop_codon:yes gene_type:complete